MSLCSIWVHGLYRKRRDFATLYEIYFRGQLLKNAAFTVTLYYRLTFHSLHFLDNL